MCMKRERNRRSTFACVTLSHKQVDVRTVTGRFGARRVASDHRRIKRLSQLNLHGVVRRHVLAQLPRASQEVEMGVTVEIEVGEIGNRVGRSVG